MIVKTGLENLLKSRWTEWLDKTQLIRKVMIDTRDAELPISSEWVETTSPLKVTVSSIDLHTGIDSPYFEIQIDFQINRDGGTAIGFHVYVMDLNGNFLLKETHGSLFTKTAVVK